MTRFSSHPLALAATFLCLLLSPVTRAAESVALSLTMNDVLIEGDNPQSSLGRANTIECVSLESEFFRPAGLENVVHRPVKIVKLIDKSTPLLARALNGNETGTAIFKFFRPDPTGNGTTQQFFTVTLDGVHITSDRILLPNTHTPGTSNSPPLEEVTFTYTSIRITYTPTGAEAELRVR